MNPQAKLFQHDMRPVYRALPSRPEWTRVKQPVPSSMERGVGDTFAITMTHKVDSPASDTLYFAFTYPNLYADCMAKLAWLDELYGQPVAQIAPPAAPPVPPAALPPVVVASLPPDPCTWFAKGVLSQREGATVAGDGAQADADVARERPDLGALRHAARKAAVEAGMSAPLTAPPPPPPPPAPAPPPPPPAHPGASPRDRAPSRAPPAPPDPWAWLTKCLRARDGAEAVQGAEAVEGAAVEGAATERDGALASAVASAPAATDGISGDAPSTHDVEERGGVAKVVSSSGGSEASVKRNVAPRSRLEVVAEIGAAAACSAAKLLPATPAPNLYYRRELLCRSLEGRRIDLITITGTNGLPEPWDATEPEAPLPAPLLPEASSRDGYPRPHAFPNRPVVLVSARVHPGETPASHVLDGLLAFLVRTDDPRAAALRERFVFKLIPMLNPDGVYRGHYRTDTRGVNLNRVYLEASAAEHPSIHACCAVVQQLHKRGALHLFVDCHAHAGKRGCFLYGNLGNSFDELTRAGLFAKLVSLNTLWLDFAACQWFESERMEGSARAAVYKHTGLPTVYTLECNYDSGISMNELPKKYTGELLESAEMSSCPMTPEAPRNTTVSHKYDEACYQEIGKALALAVLDMAAANPASRLGPRDSWEDTSEETVRYYYKGLAKTRGAIRQWAEVQLTSAAKRRANIRPRSQSRKGNGGGDEEEDPEDLEPDIDADDEGE